MKISKLLKLILMPLIGLRVVDGEGGGGSDRQELASLFEAAQAEDDGADLSNGDERSGSSDEVDLDLGDENGEQPEEPNDGENEPVFEIPVGDGKTVQKTQSELIAEASKYHGANKKFEEAAAIRKDAEAQLAQLPEREKQLGVVLEHYIRQSQALMPQEPDWRQLLIQDQQNGTNHYQFARLDWENRQRELMQARQMKEMLNQRNAEAQAVTIRGTLDAEKAKLIEAIPDWKDPNKAAEGAKAIGDYLSGQGIPAEMQSQMDSAAVFLIARKAMLYDQALARQKSAREGTKQAPRVERPGSRQIAPPRDQMAKANAGKAFKADPSVKTLAAFFE